VSDVKQIMVCVHGRQVRIPEGSRLTVLPGNSILVLPPAGVPGFSCATEYTVHGEVKGHPSLLAEGDDQRYRPVPGNYVRPR
jgi:D-lyxose ketol-isomerase